MEHPSLSDSVRQFARLKKKCNPKPWKFQDWKPTPEQIQAMYWENEQYYYTQNLGYIP